MILSISNAGIHNAKKNEPIIGVISVSAGFIGNAKEGDANSVLVGLVGQVETIVYLHPKQEIYKGDSIALSDMDGIGHKSDTTLDMVGIALESSKDKKRILCSTHDESLSCVKVRILLRFK